jgi:hypothetical protein
MNVEEVPLMRRPRKLFLFLLFVPLALSAQSKVVPGFAVVELFTSEGCLSCPPADEALSQLVRRADREKLPIYALEWHVDYWDYLGWKDPWDSRLATERQYAYARTLPSSVYTPQAVINGYAVPRNAGDLAELEADARLAAATPAQEVMGVSAHEESPTSVRISLKIANAPSGAEVLLAEVEGDLRAKPDVGENAGRSLVHSNVVRAARIIPAATGEAAMNVPPATAGTTRRIVAILENSSTLRMLAAAQAVLSAPAADSLSGRIIDKDGKPVSGVRIRACSKTVCIPATTGADGYFALDSLPAGSYELDFDLPASGARARVQFLQRPVAVRIMRTVWRVSGGGDGGPIPLSPSALAQP